MALGVALGVALHGAPEVPIGTLELVDGEDVFGGSSRSDGRDVWVEALVDPGAWPA